MHIIIREGDIMKKSYFDYYPELEDDEIFSEENYYDEDSEENYPSAEEYNRIHKQKYDKF